MELDAEAIRFYQNLPTTLQEMELNAMIILLLQLVKILMVL